MQNEIKKNNSNNDASFDEKQSVVFKIGNEEFGVNINDVQEIIRMESITKIPNTADYIEGVINLRGGIIVVINLAKKLGLTVKESDSNTRIIVTEVNDSTVGMVVDSATEVLRLSSKDIQPAPAIVTQKIDSDYIEGVGIIGERLLILLDLSKVIESKEMAQIAGVHEKMQSVSDKVQAKEETKTEVKTDDLVESVEPDVEKDEEVKVDEKKESSESKDDKVKETKTKKEDKSSDSKTSKKAKK
jgi:purine-binding chemotaxis protein CheW